MANKYKKRSSTLGVTSEIQIKTIIKYYFTPTAAAAAAAAAKSLQSCPTVCDTIDGSPPGSPVPGIL